MSEILVVGFPKSGNTWLSRLLSAALDWPVRGINEARPLAEQGRDRADKNVIRQLHLYPKHEGDQLGVIPHQYIFNLDALNGQHQIVHIVRDPRDVSVAIDYYWGIGNLLHTIRDVMARGVHPLWGCGWAQYVDTWRAAPVPVIETRYEWLHADPLLELRRIMDMLKLRAVETLGEVVKRESFDERRARIAGAEGETLAHGKGAQLANLRGGRVGDWRAEFQHEHLAAAHEVFTKQLLELGYESDPEWHLARIQTC